MSDHTTTALEEYLGKFSEQDWLSGLESLLPSIHEVDRNAVQIWFRFYPLSVVRFIEQAEDKEAALKSLAILGNFGLADRIDSSHSFLHGHRYWKTVKSVLVKEMDSFRNADIPITDEIVHIATRVAEEAQVERPLVIAIAAVGLMTLNQVGAEAFTAKPAAAEKPAGLLAKSPDQIVAARNRDDSQGLFGFLKTIDKKYSVIYDETQSSGRFPVINDQEIASASANDRSQDWQTRDPRCWEGPVPVECTAASCGTCWVGVLAGAEKLSDVAPRERRAVKLFGYNQPEDPHPFIRLACQARAAGNVTIVIPPWNGVFGKKIYGNVEDVELEPATTSARALRDVTKTTRS